MVTSDIAYGFAASQERESERVAADYLQYLGRGAQTAEIQYWVNVFENGGSNEQVKKAWDTWIEAYKRRRELGVSILGSPLTMG